MKNFINLNAHIILFSSLFLAMITGYRCAPDSNSIKPPLSGKPLLIIIGADISKTFQDNDPLTQSHIKEICDLVVRSGNGGMITFQTVGNSSKKDMLRVEIPVVRDTCNDMPASQKIQCKQQYLKDLGAAKENLSEFVSKCGIELSKQKEFNTDINGFMRRAKTIISGPASDGHDVIVYLHSDGKQDLDGKKQLVCDAFPEVNILTSGWINSEVCNISQQLATPADFILYIKKKSITKK